MADRAFQIMSLMAALVLSSIAVLAHADGIDATLQTLQVTEGSFRQQVSGCAATSHRPLRVGMDSRPKRLHEALVAAEVCRKDLLGRVNSVAEFLHKAFKDGEKRKLIEQWQRTTARDIQLLKDPKQDQTQLGDQTARDYDELVFDLSW